MAVDKANIFKLEKNEFEKYENDPFYDCFESTRVFAESLKEHIETRELPHVLLLQAEYGMGKTFFTTRFTTFLNKHKKSSINTIYFSAWENDYCISPFACIINELSFYYKNKFKEVLKKASPVIKDLTILAGITYATVNTPVITLASLIACFKNFFDVKKMYKKNKISHSKQEEVNYIDTKKHIKKFKETLADFIENKLPNKKLIIIVDELDRCRPDYAMKILECLKHFFDIEGLFFIIPANKNSLDNAYKALYGNYKNDEDKTAEITEWYFQKFFNDTWEIEKPNLSEYAEVISKYITKETLNVALEKKCISSQKSRFNSLDTLINNLAISSSEHLLTIRELKDICKKVNGICNKFKENEEIRTEILCEEICKKHSHRKQNIDRYKNNDIKQQLLIKRHIHDWMVNPNRNSISMPRPHIGGTTNFERYADATATINKTLNLLRKEIKLNPNRYPVKTIDVFKKHREDILKQKKDLMHLYYSRGIDDHNESRINKYKEIINKPQKIYQ